MDFERILPDNFFNLFQSKHRDLYIEALILIYKEYEKGSILGMNRDVAVEILLDYLEKNAVTIDDEENGNAEIVEKREQTYYIIRRIEKCGWIDIDVTNDYVQILNFPDYAITFVTAFMEIKKNSQFSLFADNNDIEAENHFKGYIFTIYSLLMNEFTSEYGMMLDQVYKNTIQFIRELRKVDQRLKDYINGIFERTEIKDLMELLISYKNELADQAYYKLKTSDNVNKYRLEIIKKLEDLQSNALIMNMIANEQLVLNNYDFDLSLERVNKKINDIIDIFNSLDQVIDEIDNKNRTYVNQTIAKIKYILNSDVDILGELNTIMRFMNRAIVNDRTDFALDKIKNLFTLNKVQSLSQKSLTTIRGTYERTEMNVLNSVIVDKAALTEEFYKTFSSKYTENSIIDFIHDKLEPFTYLQASKLISSDPTMEDIIKLLYIVVYSSTTDEYDITPTREIIQCDEFDLYDFIITRR